MLVVVVVVSAVIAGRWLVLIAFAVQASAEMATFKVATRHGDQLVGLEAQGGASFWLHGLHRRSIERSELVSTLLLLLL